MLADFLKDNSLVYVTKDIERASGLPPQDGFYIISNKNQASTTLLKEYPYHALLIEEKEELNTLELLQHQKTAEYINSLPHPHIVVFKNTPLIEGFCTSKNWSLLNPDASLAKKVEEKMSQVAWLGDLAHLLPRHEITVVKNLTWYNEPYIIQFNHGHTGESTLLITDEKVLNEIKTQFPNRDVRKTKYIEGPVFTNNNIVSKNLTGGYEVIAGNISYQITGLKPFTTIPFSTIGNDWALPHKLLSKDQFAQYYEIVSAVGKKLAQDGWKGFFGIDIKVDQKSGELFLLEINARQPASASFESFLQLIREPQSAALCELHLLSLIELSRNSELKTPSISEFPFEFKNTSITVTDGAQIVQRLTPVFKEKHPDVTSLISALSKCNLRVISYANTKPNSDLLRIQSASSLMDTDNTFNELGHFIENVLS